LRQLCQRFDWKLPVLIRFAVLRAEAKVRPIVLVTESPHPWKCVWLSFPRANIVKDCLVEARAPPRDLIGDVRSVALPHEVLIPTHAAIWRGLPTLAG